MGSGENAEYYVNAESDSLTNTIIFCRNKKCVKQTPEKIPSYYIGVDKENVISGLIECVESSNDITGGGNAGTGRRKRDDNSTGK